MKFYIPYGAILLLVTFVASLNAHPTNVNPDVAARDVEIDARDPEKGFYLAEGVQKTLMKAIKNRNRLKLATAGAVGLGTGAAVAVPIITSRDDGNVQYYRRAATGAVDDVLSIAAKKGKMINLKNTNAGYIFKTSKDLDLTAELMSGSWTKPLVVAGASGIASGLGAAAVLSSRDAVLDARDPADFGMKQFGHAVKAAGGKYGKTGLWKAALVGAAGAGAIAIPVAATVGRSPNVIGGGAYPINQSPLY